MKNFLEIENIIKNGEVSCLKVKRNSVRKQKEISTFCSAAKQNILACVIIYFPNDLQYYC